MKRTHGEDCRNYCKEWIKGGERKREKGRLAGLASLFQCGAQPPAAIPLTPRFGAGAGGEHGGPRGGASEAVPLSCKLSPGTDHHGKEEESLCRHVQRDGLVGGDCLAGGIDDLQGDHHVGLGDIQAEDDRAARELRELCDAGIVEYGRSIGQLRGRARDVEVRRWWGMEGRHGVAGGDREDAAVAQRESAENGYLPLLTAGKAGEVSVSVPTPVMPGLAVAQVAPPFKVMVALVPAEAATVLP